MLKYLRAAKNVLKNMHLKFLGVWIVNEVITSLMGFKAVSEQHGNELLKKRVFHVTVADELKEEYHWLGNGIYFYPDKADAEDWAKNEKGKNSFVVSAQTIELCSYEIFEFGDMMDEEFYKLKHQESRDSIDSNSLHIGKIKKVPSIFEFRHKYAENIWERYPKVKVCIARFPTVKLTDCPKVDGVDIRRRRKEFCVRKVEYIDSKSIKKV